MIQLLGKKSNLLHKIFEKSLQKSISEYEFENLLTISFHIGKKLPT